MPGDQELLPRHPEVCVSWPNQSLCNMLAFQDVPVTDFRLGQMLIQVTGITGAGVGHGAWRAQAGQGLAVTRG